MAQIIKRVDAHYEAREVPFGKVYEWHPAYVVLACDCSEQLIINATSTITTCHRCGADLGGFAHDIEEREGLLPDTLTPPWFHGAQARETNAFGMRLLILKARVGAKTTLQGILSSKLRPFVLR